MDSPNTNKDFRKTVAKRVDFSPDEKLFNTLTKLDLSENSDPNEIAKKQIKKHKNSSAACANKRDPEPNLGDFHQVFQGQSIPCVPDGDEISSKIIAQFYHPDKDWPEKFRKSQTKFQDKFKR